MEIIPNILFQLGISYFHYHKWSLQLHTSVLSMIYSTPKKSDISDPKKSEHDGRSVHVRMKQQITLAK